MEKNLLVETLIESTELPDTAIRNEFHSLLQKYGKTEAELTLEDLREIMTDYLQDVFLGIAQENTKIAN